MPENIQKQIERLNKQVDDLYNEGQYQQGIDPAEQICDLTRQHFGENQSDFAQTLNNLGALYFTIGDYGKAEPCYLNALDIRERILGKRHSDYLMSLKGLALLYKRTREYDRAVPLFEAFLEIEPGNDQMLGDLSTIFRNTGQYEKGEDLVRHILESEGENNFRLETLFLFYLDQKKYREWETFLLNSIQKDSRNPFLYENLFFVYKMLEEPSKQKETLFEAIDLGLESFDIYLELGKLHTKSNKKEKTIQALSRAQKMIPHDSFAWLQLGQEYMEIDAFEEATEVLGQAKEKFPEDVEILKHLNLVFLYLGDAERAEKILTELMKLLDLTDKKRVSELAEWFLDAGEASVASCPEALDFLEETYYNLPDVDTSQWVFSRSQFSGAVAPKWLIRFSSFANPFFERFDRLPYAKRISNILGMPLVFLFFAAPFLLIAWHSFPSQIEFFRLFGFFSTVAWSATIALAAAFLVTGFITGGVEKAKTTTILQKARRVGSYFVSFVVLYWCGGQLQQSPNEMYQIGGKTITWVAFIDPVFSFLTDLISWRFSDKV